MDQLKLEREIEQCRKHMIELSRVYSLTSKHVIQVSEELDNLLNTYSKTRNSSSFYA